MIFTKLFSAGLTSAVIMIASQSIAAQIPNFYSSPGYTAMINVMIENKIMENYLKKGSRGGSGGSRSTSSGQASRAEVPAYRRYPAVQFKSTGTRLTLQEYLDSVNGTPKEKAELKELVVGIFKRYEAEAADNGYPNDWALAFVSYVGLNSHIYYGRTEKPILPFEQNIGIRYVVAEYATDHGIFNNVTDRQKQELYELFVMVGGLTYHFYEKALNEKNAKDIADTKAMAAQNLKMIGVKP